MKVGIIQSNYIPWRGYFDFIHDLDLFIYHDDLQYTKGDWRNRNKIKTPQGAVYLTVPVHYHSASQLIRETTIDYSQKWVSKHCNQFRAHYGKAPYFERYSESLFNLLRQEFETISELNRTVNDWIMDALSIHTPTRLSSEFDPQGAKTERLIGILKEAGATTYLSGPSGRNYLDVELFAQAGIALEYKGYDYEPYPQLHGDFEPNVSVVDLLFNCGEGARDYLKSKTPNQAIEFD